MTGPQAVQAGLPLDELSSRRTDYATGAKLAPLFGRKGKVAKRGNNHGLKVSFLLLFFNDFVLSLFCLQDTNNSSSWYCAISFFFFNGFVPLRFGRSFDGSLFYVLYVVGFVRKSVIKKKRVALFLCVFFVFCLMVWFVHCMTCVVRSCVELHACFG